MKRSSKVRKGNKAQGTAEVVSINKPQGLGILAHGVVPDPIQGAVLTKAETVRKIKECVQGRATLTETAELICQRRLDISGVNEVLTQEIVGLVDKDGKPLTLAKAPTLASLKVYVSRWHKKQGTLPGTGYTIGSKDGALAYTQQQAREVQQPQTLDEKIHALLAEACTSLNDVQMKSRCMGIVTDFLHKMAVKAAATPATPVKVAA